MLTEAQRLYRLGFAVHWLHSKQKRPIEPGWTTGPRKRWDYLKETYIEGLNVGARMGTPSLINGHYLACIDVDIKDLKYRAAALESLKTLVGENVCPEVRSGAGNGSRHLYCLTKEPFKMVTWAKVKDQWEICIYSDGRQMVLPPSIHPNGSVYTWKRHLQKPSDLPLVEFTMPAAAPGEIELDFTTTTKQHGVFEDVTFTKVEIDWLPITDEARDAIKSGNGVIDRSGYLLQATTALFSAGLGRNEILSVLTDPENWLAACAYEHAQTKSRKRAARWLWTYTVRKVIEERNGENFFTPVKGETKRKLTPEQIKQELEDIAEETDWRTEIERGGKNGDEPPRHTVENVVLILEHAVGKNVVRRNEFAFRDAYGLDTPWGGKRNEIVTDDDVAKIKLWLGQRFRFEPSDKVIFDALINIACRNSFDPICDMLDSLPAWDKTPRLDSWLADNFEATGDADYLAQVFKKWLVGMVMRAKRPGSKFDWMPIFEGKQGVGKSSFGRLLVGDKYFVDWLPNLADKDSALALQGMWGIEMGELANMRKNELETVKAYITRTIDKVRPPYGRRWLEHPRRCVFFGTTNRSTYLTDDTGNRRFKPLMVGNLNFEALRRDRHQLFAEALAIWKEIEAKRGLARYFDLTGNALIFEAKIHGEKTVDDEASVMFEAMQDFVEKVDNETVKFDFEKFRILELFGGLGPLQKWRQDNRNYQFAAKMLKKMSGEKRLIKGKTYWKIPQGGGHIGEPPTPDFY